MQNQLGNFNPKDFLDSLRQFVGSAVTPPNVSTKPRSEDARARAVFSVLFRAPKNLSEIESAIRAASAGVFSPKASEILQILEKAKTDGFVSSKSKGDRKIYSLTETGEKFLASAPIDETQTSETKSQTKTGAAFGVDPVVVAGAKLATAVAAVAQECNQEQKQRAAIVLDETRRKLYAILAKD